MNRLLWVLGMLLILGRPAFCDPSLKKEDFAYGLKLSPNTTAPVYEFALPHRVYRGTTRADLGDIRVFNAQGEVVPHGLYSPPARTEPLTATLPLFPLPEDTNQQDRLLMRLSKQTPDATLEVKIDDQSTRDQSVQYYLLDARSLKTPVRGLTLYWSPESRNFLYQVTVEYSDDLQHWRRLVDGARIADLTFGDQRLERHGVEFLPVQANYFRLMLSGRGRLLALEKVTAELVGEAAERPLQWTTVTSADRVESGKYHFQLPGQVPVRALRIDLPQKNTLVRVSVYSRLTEDERWRFRGQSLLYHLLVAGEPLVRDELTLEEVVSDRYWRLHIDQSGGGLGNAGLQVEVGWAPHSLVFVTRGRGPFILAYGSARAEPALMDADLLLKPMGEETPEELISRDIDVSEGMVLGGPQALQRPWGPENWKQVLLWGILVGGVLVLGWMARYLLREIKTRQ